MTCKISDLISTAFHESHRAVKSGDITELVESGGRGSTKSSFVSIEIILLILLHPECHAAVFRKVGNTLRTSVYAQICWAIAALGLSDKFRCTVSTMECTYIKTGQKILFFGLDDPGKVKSIKVPFGYIGIGWFEELDQFAGPEEIRNVEQSLFRGGAYSMCFKSFNPPASPRNWANQYVREEKPGKMCHHSTYLTTPPEWLGPRFISDAEYLKESNPTAYAHEYIGEVTGCGKEIFTNIRTDTIAQAQIDVFDRVYHGVDWGWYPDPWAFNSCYYHAGKKTLYIFDELTRHRTPNEDTFKLLQERRVGFGNGLLTADSAERKSCADYTRWGLRCIPAIKGPGSVEQGCKWLQSLNAIVIDPKRCPDTAKEFLEYEYEADKDGTPLPGYPDYNNHHIDAVRYSLESVWRRAGQ